ncbi:hypothetical protein Tco_1156449 [Tanacetum coccineum]
MFDEYFKNSSVASNPIFAATLPPPDTAKVFSSSSTSIDKDFPLQVLHQTLKKQSVQSILQMLNQMKKLRTKAELNNYKEVMEESCWIEAMQEEIPEFKRLENKARYQNILSIRCTQEFGSISDVCEDGIFEWDSEVRGYGLDQCDAVDIPMVGQSKLDEDPNGTPAKPTKKHLNAVKRVFWYLKGTINMGMWYPKDTGFNLTAFADADHAGCQYSRKSISGSAQFLGEKLVSWSSKKQKMRSQLTDYGFPLYSDSYSAIALSYNTMQHSRTKHIVVGYHFIKEQVENGVVELYFVKTDYQLADIFTKALTRERFEFLIKRLGMQSITPEELKGLVESDKE